MHYSKIQNNNKVTANIQQNILKEDKNNVIKIPIKSKDLESKNNKASKNTLEGLKKVLEFYIMFFQELKSQNKIFKLNKNNDEILIDDFKNILTENKDHFIQFAYENRTEWHWYWFVYWRWHMTWDGLLEGLEILNIRTRDIRAALRESIRGAGGISLLVTSIKLALTQYLGIASVPVIGWVAGTLIAAFVASLGGSIISSRLWNHPQGIVVAFFWCYLFWMMISVE